MSETGRTPGTVETAVCDRLAAEAVGALQQAVPPSVAWLRGSLAAGQADHYSDIDLLWEIPDGDFAEATERLPAILERLRPLASLRADPLLQRSAKHRLYFVRFAGLPLFWRLDLEVCARSIGRDRTYDLDNPSARGTEWSLAESALANGVAAIKTHRRGRDDEAEGLLERAFSRLGQPSPPGDFVRRVRALALLASKTDPALDDLATRVAALAAGQLFA